VVRGHALDGDFRAHELALAVMLALPVPLCAAMALSIGNLRKADVREIDPGIAVPIQVTPVVDLDSPLLKLGGKKVRIKLPDAWMKPEPVARTEAKAQVSTKAGDTVADIPPPDLAVSDAGTPVAPDAAVAKQVEAEIDASADAASAGADTPGAPDGVPDGTETDPLKARAANLYHANIASWFLRKFHPSCAGLGDADIDAAARQAMDQATGQQIPPPPENYPELRQNSFGVTFVCRK
jgi:hypothetical protein